MIKTLGHYKITYDNGIVQYKHLISHEIYENILSEIKDIIYELSINKKQDEANALKKVYKRLVPFEFFTDKSPIYDAIKTGILSLPKQQGGDSKCIVEKCDN